MSFDVHVYLYSQESKEAIRYGWTDSLFPAFFNKNQESMLLSAFLAKNKNLEVCLDGDPKIESKDVKMITRFTHIGWTLDDIILYIAENHYTHCDIDQILGLWYEEDDG